jgi:hypothetical protein
MMNTSSAAAGGTRTGASIGRDGFLVFAGMAAFAAMLANIADIALGYGSGGEPLAYGTRRAVEWFGIFAADPFGGLYALGILNLVYQTMMVPVYCALCLLHFRGRMGMTVLAAALFVLGAAVYFSNNPAIPLYALSAKYALAPSQAEKAFLSAAGEALLARGEDFTPGSFAGLILGGASSIVMSVVMLRGGRFGRTLPWTGVVGFSFLSAFILVATFLPALYTLAFYSFGMLGGLLALAWFALLGTSLIRLSARGAGAER